MKVNIEGRYVNYVIETVCLPGSKDRTLYDRGLGSRSTSRDLKIFNRGYSPSSVVTEACRQILLASPLSLQLRDLSFD
jgi:hypothetical protein